MSDSAPIAAESAAEPVSSAEIAASVVESAEQESSSTSADSVDGLSDAETAPATETTETAPTKAEREIQSKAADFLLKLGHKPINKHGGNTYMPYHTVAKMLDKYAEEHSAGWTTERGTLESRAKELQGHLDEMYADIKGDPRALIEKIAAVDPRYRQFIEARAEAAAATPSVEMPAPDLPLADGSRTYSVEGIQKLIEWAVDAKMLPKVNERLKPWEEREKQAEEQAKYDATVADVQTKAQTRLREAESWPDWADYKADVEKKLIEDTQKARGEGRRWGSMSLREAYLEVRANKVRESVLKEMQNAPKVPALSRGTTDAPKAPNGPVKTVDIVRQVIAKAEHGTGA